MVNLCLKMRASLFFGGVCLRASLFFRGLSLNIEVKKQPPESKAVFEVSFGMLKLLLTQAWGFQLVVSANKGNLQKKTRPTRERSHELGRRSCWSLFKKGTFMH